MSDHSTAEKGCDTVFRALVFTRDEYQCQRCGMKFNKGSGELTVSHFEGRAIRPLRWDLRNADAMCGTCHQKIEHAKAKGSWYYEWKKRMMGAKDFAQLIRDGKKTADHSTMDLRLLRKVMREQLKSMLAQRVGSLMNAY